MPPTMSSSGRPGRSRRRVVRRGLAPLLAVSLALGASLAGGPSSAQRQPDPGRDLDGPAHALKPADAAELAAALGVKAPTARLAGARLAQQAQRTVAVAPRTGPDFEMPFTCGTTWTGSSRSSHSPSRYAVDWNAPNDLRKPVLAAAAGTVVLVRSLTYSYGKYVVVDHGGGYTTLYAHLDSLAASVGQRVDQGDLIGNLGTTGGSTGPHLHFEERLNGAYFTPYFTRTAWTFGRTAASGNCGDRPVAGDWDGNRRDETGLYQPRATGATFRAVAGSAAADVAWGTPGDLPAVGDYNGDRRSQYGVKKLGSSTWQLRSGAGTVATVAGVGGTADVPLVGDWDGNGRAELGWYRWSNRTFYLRWPDLTVKAVTWGASGSVPVVGDWDGDGRADVGSYDPVTRTWSLRVPAGAGATTRTLAYGAPGDLPVVGDWDGDRVDDLGVWRPATGTYYLRSTADGVRVTSQVFGTPRG